MKAFRRSGSNALEWNALALMVGTVVTALVGVLFWAAAARYYTVAEVGRASAVISTAAFLGQVANLNLGNVYARFLPAAGWRIRSLVRRGLALTGAVGLLAGTGFVLLWPNGSLFASTTETTLFPLAVAVLTVFTVQDYVLIGLRAATWVPVENIIFSVAKLILLVVLAGALPRNGLVVAWVAPAALAVIVVVTLLHRTLMPRQMRVDTEDRLPSARALVNYASAEFGTGLMIFVVPMVLPLIIVSALGTEANAYFSIPWVISSGLTMLTWNVAASFVVEAATDERRTRALTRRSLRLAMAVACAGSVTLLLGAPILLGIFGPAYAEHGSTLLRLMALAAPATVVSAVYSSVLRVRRQVGRVVLVQTFIGTSVITSTLLLVGGHGITGVGIAYLCTEAVVGAALLVPLLRSIREPKQPLPGNEPPVSALLEEKSDA